MWMLVEDEESNNVRILRSFSRGTLQFAEEGKEIRRLSDRRGNYGAI